MRKSRKVQPVVRVGSYNEIFPRAGEVLIIAKAARTNKSRWLGYDVVYRKPTRSELIAALKQLTK
jgi:hypothetical protein